MATIKMFGLDGSEKGAVVNVTVGGRSKKVTVPACADWTVMEAKAGLKVTGNQDITVELVSGSAEIDWVSFR